jgi:hypothetical protein
MVDGAVLINRSVIRMNWLASKHNLKMVGRSFGWKKIYGLTVTVLSEPWWARNGGVFCGFPRISHPLSVLGHRCSMSETKAKNNFSRYRYVRV